MNDRRGRERRGWQTTVSAVQHITSRQNERVKSAIKLRNSRQRAKQGRFVIDGARQIARALQAGIRVAEAFLCTDRIDSVERQAAADRLSESGAVCATVSAEVYAKLSFGDNDDGLLAVAETPDRQLESLTLPPNPLIAVLEGLEKPGNVGAILRSADAAGLDAVIVANPGTDLFNPNTIRASMGTVFAENVRVASNGQILAQLRAWNLPIVATLVEATQLYSEIDYRSGAAIVLGSEDQGLTSAWQCADVQPVRLPMHGIADSLNVSATAAVMFYEAHRQRQAPK